MIARTTHALAALLARALLTLLYARALDGLVGLPFLLGALLLATVAGYAAGNSPLRLWVVGAAGVLAVAAMRFVSVGLAASVAAAALSPGSAAFLQRLDAGTLAALPVVALGFAGAIGAARRAELLRWEPLVHGLLALALLWSQANYRLTYFERPWVLVLIVGALALLDVLLMVDPRILSRGTLARGSLLAVPLLLLALLLSVRWYSTGGTEAGGGILRPTLFRFDFAPFVRLESEISMSDELVLLYRRSGRARRELVRRYVLSDYDPGRGFSIADVAAHPARAGDARSYLERESVRQEYFLVNLDPGTRLALNEPVEFVRFENWDDSSFTAAFAAESMVSRAPPFRLARAEPGIPDEARLELLTDYGGHEAIRALAEEVTAGLDGPYAFARAIEIYLQDNYSYSLRPGIAADGDQLAHFLFGSRKGYCSYFAFSMTLMLRSLGVPSRVAVGFFVDPGQEVLNFYPVLANMAHAWVEVHLGEYGWIAFDPTSQTLAPGERYEFGSGADPRELASLLEEILAQELREASPVAAPRDDASGVLLPEALRSLLRAWYLVVPAVYLALVLLLRAAPFLRLIVCRQPARRSVLRARLALDRAAACGVRRAFGESLRAFGERVEIDGMSDLTALYERALFAADLPSDHDERSRRAMRRVLRGVRATVPFPRRLGAFLLPRPGRRGPGRSRGGAMLALLLLLAGGVRAQESPEWYREQSGDAIAAERYDRAVDILQEAQLHHGSTAEFFMALGDLYYDEELYGLALREYLRAEEREPTTYEVLEAVAFCLGLLNREEESARYWMRLVELYPERIEPAQNLGWLLFKLHRLDEGVRLLLDAWDRFGPDADLAMTLGTLRAEQYRFAEARDWYERSIELAGVAESSRFVAVAFYNLSLIQKLFHRYGEALDSTNASIDVLPRPTGYLARGELHELRMDFAAAHADYLRAYDTDDETPLARLNLALLYRRFGRLDEALAFAESVLHEPDSSWLYYYGTDATRHRMEVHDLLAEIHDGLARHERARLVAGPIGWAARALRVARHAVLGWYHRARFRSYATTVATSVLEGGNLIDGTWYLYRASEGRAAVARAYLDRAERFETARIPDSAPFYAVERALLNGDPARLLALSAELDSVWQRHLREEALVGALTRGPREYNRVAAAGELYRINPGAFRQHAIALPVRLVAPPTLDSRRLRRMLARVGLDARGDENASRPLLTLEPRNGLLRARLSLAGSSVGAEVPIAGRRPSAAALNELADALFAVE